LSAAKTTAVVSIHEEKNTEVEIPRNDPEDNPKLWTSKLEIHHNTMMTQIRGMVQEKIFDEVANNNDFFAGIEDITLFFAGIEDITLEIDDDTDDDDDDDDDGDDSWQDQKQQKLETKKDIHLAKKVQLLQSLLNGIMELPKDGILAFLMFSSLPTSTGLNRSSAKSLGRQLHRREQTEPFLSLLHRIC
jgi:hypothetical protein